MLCNGARWLQTAVAQDIFKGKNAIPHIQEFACEMDPHFTPEYFPEVGKQLFPRACSEKFKSFPVNIQHLDLEHTLPDKLRVFLQVRAEIGHSGCA